MKVKKLLALITIGTMILGCLAGCGKKTERGVVEGETTLNIRAYKSRYYAVRERG